MEQIAIGRFHLESFKLSKILDQLKLTHDLYIPFFFEKNKLNGVSNGWTFEIDLSILLCILKVNSQKILVKCCFDNNGILDHAILS